MILGLLTAVFWGVADFLIKLLGDRLSLRGSIFWTQTFAAAILTGCVLATGQLPYATLPDGILPMLAAEAVTNALGLGLLYAAFSQGRVAVVAPLVGAYAIVATLIGLISGTEAVSLPVLLVLGLISLGAALVTLEGGGHGGLHPNAGALAAIGSALASGLSIWIAATHVLPRVAVTDVLLSNFALLASAAAAWPAGTRIDRPRGARIWLLLLGVAAGCVAGYGCYNIGLSQGGIAIVSVIATLSSAVTILLAGCILRERPCGLQRIGLVIVICGLPLLAAIREIGVGP